MTTANLVANGNFATGDFTDWTLGGNYTSGQIFIDTDGEGGSTYAAGLGSTGGSDGTLSQTIATTAGQTYTLSFWLQNEGGAASNDFTAMWDGQPLLALTNASASGYTEYTFTVTAIGATSTLEFSAANNASQWNLDNISLTAGSSTSAPAAPAVSTGVENSDQSVTLAGTAPDGATVTVWNGATALGAATASSTGAWSLTTPDLSLGSYAFTATDATSAGTSAASSPLDVTVTTLPAPPSIGTGVENSNQSVTLTGTAPDGATVTVSTLTTLDGVTAALGTTTASSTGAWSFTTTALSSGIYDFTATDTTSAGTSSASNPFVVGVSSTNPDPVTYYVSSEIGNNNNAGTSESAPLATLQAAADLVKAGDTVEVMNGTYTTGGGDVLDITTSGTASAPITFEAAPGQTPVINSSGSWNAINVEASYIVVSGFTVVGDAANYTLAQALAGYSSGNANLDGNGIAINGNHVTIENNTVYNEPGGGIYTEGADYVQILNNVVYDNAHWSAFGNSGISISTSANSDTNAGVHDIVSGNLVYGNAQLVPTTGGNTVTDGEGIILDTNPGYTGEILVENNTVYGNGSSGIESFDTNNAVITSNTVYGNDTGNVQAASVAQIFINQSNNNTVTNNTTTAPDTSPPAAPVISSDTVSTSDAVTLKGTAPDGATVTVSDGTSLGTTTASSTGSWSFTTADLAAGSYAFTATDTTSAGTSAASSPFPVTVTSASSPPAAPVISSDTVSTSDAVTLKGTAPDGATVTVSDGTSLGTTTASSTGSWSFTTADLAAGSYTFTATDTTSAGTSAASSPFPVTVTSASSPPAAPVISSDTVSTSDAVTLKGTAPDGATVTVSDGTSLGTTTASSTGSWSFTTADLAAGSYTFTATDTTSAGTSAASSPFPVTVTSASSPPAAPVISSDTVSTSDAVTLKGTAPDGATVTVSDGKSLGTTTASSTGSWSFTTADLAAGSYAFTATDTTSAGTSAASSPFPVTVTSASSPPAAPVISSDTVSTSDAVTLKGTAPDGATVTVSDGTSLGTTTASRTGSWSFTTADLAAGSYTFTATDTTSAGTSAASSPFPVTVTSASSPPAAPVISSDTVSTSDAVTLKGTAPDGATVTVSDGTSLGTTTASSTGSWSFTTADLAAGSYTFTATDTTSAGTSAASSPFPVTVTSASSPPAAPVISSDTVSTSDAVTLKGTAPDGATVTVSDGTSLGTTTASSTGSWSFTTADLAAGSYTFTATDTTSAGTSAASSPFGVTVAPSDPPPPASGPNLVANGNFATGDFTDWTLGGNTIWHHRLPEIFITTNAEGSSAYAAAMGSMGPSSSSDGTLSQTIATTPGQTYTLSFWLQNEGSTGNDFQAIWNGQTLLSLSNMPQSGYTEYTYTVTATSSATTLGFSALNNPSQWDLDNISLTATGLTTGQAAPAVQSGAVNISGTDPTVTLTGTAPDGTTVTVSDGGSTPLGTTTASSTGAWSFTTADLAAGSYAFTATDTTSAGTSAASSPFDVTVTPPPSDAAPVISSIAESPSSGDLNVGKTVTYSIALSEAVTVSGTPQLMLNDGGTASYASGSGTSTLTFVYTVAAGQNTPDPQVTQVNLNGGSISDGAGDAANLSLTGVAQGSPAIESSVLESPASGDLNAGKKVTLTLDMSENVTVNAAGGTPTLKLNDGGTATYSGGSGSNALTFSYTVGAGQNTDSLAVTAVSLNGATVQDGAGNAANLSLTGLTQAGPQIDTTVDHHGLVGLYAAPGTTLAISQGVVTIGAGATAVITAPDSASVTFNGSTGMLKLDNSSTFTGKISNFTGNGTLSGSDQIDLTNINSNTVKDSYANGVLTVSDGNGDTAKLSFNGSYTLANFDFASDGSGGTIVYDPPVSTSDSQNTDAPPPNTTSTGASGSATIGTGATLELAAADSGSVASTGSKGTSIPDGTSLPERASNWATTVSGPGAQNVIDLPDIAFGAQTTLGYLPDSNWAGGTSSVADGTHNANIALLGNYMASSFPMASEGHGGTLVAAEAAQPDQSLLSHPHHA